MNADRELLYQHVEFLTTLRPFRNHKNLESLKRVCDYLKDEFRKCGLEPAEQKFPVKSLVYKNILASYNTEKQRRLIVGAHYDVCGDQPGADDNASAVAGLLEIARIVACPKQANFIAVVGKQSYHDFNQRVYELMKVDAGIDVQMIDHPMVESLAGLSDQQSYWEFDIPALMINDTSFIRNPNYHTMRDDISTLSFDHMREVVTSTYKITVNARQSKILHVLLP